MAQGHEFSRAATVLKLLQDTPASEAEWILYMDPQTVFDAPTVLFNFEFYAGRDLVLACNIWLLKAGDTGESCCSGVGCTSMAWHHPAACWVRRLSLSLDSKAHRCSPDSALSDGLQPGQGCQACSSSVAAAACDFLPAMHKSSLHTGTSSNHAAQALQTGAQDVVLFG